VVPVPHQCWGLQLHHGCEIPLQVCLQGWRPCFGSGAAGSWGCGGYNALGECRCANGNNVPAARDEVQNYLDGRYVSASKAYHRLFAFDLHDMHPNVYHLAVHLPNEQTTYFPKGTTIGETMMRNNSTTLTRWCDLNWKAKSEYAAAAIMARNSNDLTPPLPTVLTTLYPDYPEIAMWSKSKKAWHLRKRATGWRGASRNNHVTLGIVGRMYFVQPSEGKRYYLRVLLTHVIGATCFEDLRTTHRPHTPTIVVHPF